MELRKRKSLAPLPAARRNPVMLHWDRGRGWALALVVFLAGRELGARPYIVSAGGGTSIAVTDEKAASGKQSLKFTDTGTAPRPSSPVLYIKPGFLTAGKGLFSCDLLLGKGASAAIQFRTQSSARLFPVGPTISFRDGKVMAGGKEEVASYATDRWMTLRVVLYLDGTARYDLEIGPKGGASRKFTSLPCKDPAFKKCGVIVVMSPGKKKSAFYVDNLVVKSLSK